MWMWLRSWSAMATLGLMVLASGSACAEYPVRQVRLLEPFPPGGAVDLVTGLVAAKLGQALAQPFLVESKPGAGGIIATGVAKAAPDGYTLLVTTPNHTINAALNPKLPYDTDASLATVRAACGSPQHVLPAIRSQRMM